MKGAKASALIKKIPSALLNVLGSGSAALDVRLKSGGAVDCVFEAAGQTFVVEFERSASAASLAMAIEKARALAAAFSPGAIPVVAVPFMGELGRRICQEAGVAWIDLSGNARIMTPAIRAIMDGRPNRFVSAGRPANLFAPKSSRVARWLLINHLNSGGPLTQRQIARNTDMSEGFVSRIVVRLEKEAYVERVPIPGTGAADAAEGVPRPRSEGIALRSPGLLLAAWREAYAFSGHATLRGHVAARSGEELLGRLVEALTAQGAEYAITGLAAAWINARFAAFRTVTAYLTAEPSPALLESLGWREEPAGANLWLAIPNDVGVFHGASEKDGVRIVHPIQTYVDLKEQPERSAEAAEALRTGLLSGLDHA